MEPTCGTNLSQRASCDRLPKRDDTTESLRLQQHPSRVGPKRGWLAVKGPGTGPVTAAPQGDTPSGSGDADHLRIEHWAEMLGLAGKAVLTTAETADVLRISERLVRDGIRDGVIPSIRLGRRLLVPVPMLLASLLRVPNAD